MFLLDTNALLAALVAPERLGPRARSIISDHPHILFSPISITEIAIKTMLGKFLLDCDVVALAHQTGFQEIPYSAHAAQEVAGFPGLVRHDPFDRMLLACARANQAHFLTSDVFILGLGFDWVVDSSQ
jgi:PIN domain nuclease of toxin-antitoxin system